MSKRNKLLDELLRDRMDKDPPICCHCWEELEEGQIHVCPGPPKSFKVDLRPKSVEIRLGEMEKEILALKEEISNIWEAFSKGDR